MAEHDTTTNSADGDIVGAKIGTSASGVAVGKDIVQNSIYVGRDTLDDVKTDIHFIQNDIKDVRFAIFTITTRLDTLEHREPTQDFNERTVRLIAIIFGIIVIATFILLLYAAMRGLTVGH